MVAGLTMAFVPKSLGLVAALAVSGTTLYLVYEYNKKKAFVNIQREKGSWRLEYVHGGSDIAQEPVVKKESGVCVQLKEGEEIGIGGVQWHQLRWLRQAVRRLPSTGSEAEQVSNGSRNGSLDTEQTLNDRLVKSEMDEQQADGFRDAGSHEQQQRSEHVAKFSITVTSLVRVSESEFQGREENFDNNLAASSSNDSRIHGKAATDCCSEGDFGSKPSLSSAASYPSSQRLHSLVGCLLTPGSGKTAGKPKKVVRFSPSVAEPSSNNQAYRSRFNKAETAQRAALKVQQQRTHMPSSNVAVRSIAYDRPRQTLSYSIHRYRGRSYH